MQLKSNLYNGLNSFKYINIKINQKYYSQNQFVYELWAMNEGHVSY